MKVYNEQHAYYCGIDLHARTMYLCILDSSGNKVFHKNIPCKAERFLQAIAPYRGDLVVGAECIFCWYWIADLCDREGIAFVLGHALYMKSIHGVKTKNDRIDSLKIARLLREATSRWPTFIHPACARPAT
jgi:transposase